MARGSQYHPLEVYPIHVHYPGHGQVDHSDIDCWASGPGWTDNTSQQTVLSGPLSGPWRMEGLSCAARTALPSFAPPLCAAHAGCALNLMKWDNSTNWSYHSRRNPKIKTRLPSQSHMGCIFANPNKLSSADWGGRGHQLQTPTSSAGADPNVRRCLTGAGWKMKIWDWPRVKPKLYKQKTHIPTLTVPPLLNKISFQTVKMIS